MPSGLLVMPMTAPITICVGTRSTPPVCCWMAVAIAMVRGFARHGGETIGNAWVDLTRATLYVLLPICVIGALFLASQGVPQTLAGPVNASTLEGATQVIARGPVASQEAIKLLSGDGGGFFNANSAHPFENPTALTNVFEMLLIFLIGAALTNTFGRMVGDERQGWSLFGAMMALFAVGLCVVYSAEASGNPHFAKLGIDQAAGTFQAGGNMEGKEVRFGIAGSALFANVTTASADGAVNAMHDSFTPLGGGMVIANMMMDEVIIGAPGSGLFGMLLFALVAVFVAGLMVGRTPEYLGKKIQSAEVKMAVLALLVVPATILTLTSVAAVLPSGLAGLSNANKPNLYNRCNKPNLDNRSNGESAWHRDESGKAVRNKHGTHARCQHRDRSAIDDSDDGDF